MPDVNCDVCSKGIVGPLYFRGDVVACRTCAHQINRFGNWPEYYWSLLLIPLALCLGLIVYFLILPPLLSILCVALAIFLFVVGGLKALPVRG